MEGRTMLGVVRNYIRRQMQVIATWNGGHGNVCERLPSTLAGAAQLLPYFRGDYEWKKGVPNEPRPSLFNGEIRGGRI